MVPGPQVPLSVVVAAAVAGAMASDVITIPGMAAAAFAAALLEEMLFLKWMMSWSPALTRRVGA